MFISRKGSRRRLRLPAAAVFAVCSCATLVFFVRSARKPLPVRTQVPSTLDVKQHSSLNRTQAATACSVSGGVRSVDGEQISGARVCATDVMSDMLGAQHVSCVDSGGEGHYFIALPATGAYWITAEAQGFRPRAEPSAGPIVLKWGDNQRGVDILLEHGGTKLAGLVQDAMGGPIHGAIVRATHIDPPHSTVAVLSKDDGQFVAWVEPGTVALDAEAVGYVPVRMSRIAPSSDAVLTLIPGSTIVGSVIAASDGRPIGDVEVEASRSGGSSFLTRRSATSGSDGAFRIEGLEPGSYKFLAAGVGWRGETMTPIKVGFAQHVQDVVVAVSNAPIASGRVVLAADGSPCQSGKVSLGPIGVQSVYDPPSVDEPAIGERQRSAVPSLTSAIEADGSVRFRAIVPGTYHVTVQCIGHILSGGPTILEIPITGAHDLLWQVDRGIGLVVHVVDETGSPLPGARFRMKWPVSRRGDRRLSMQVATDANGSYEFDGYLYPGSYEISFSNENAGEPLIVNLRDRDRTAEATLRVPGQGSLAITVEGSSGEPIDGVSVSAVPILESGRSEALHGGQQVASSQLDAKAPARALVIAGIPLGNGHFRIGPLEPGRYTVLANDGVNAPFVPETSSNGVVDVPRGRTVEAAITMARGASIRGLVVDASRQPLPDVWVSATCQATTSTSQSSSPLHPTQANRAASRVVTDEEGRFRLSSLRRDAQCAIRAEDPQGTSTMSRDVRAGDNITISLPLAGSISGTAVRSDGVSVAHFTLSFRESETGTAGTRAVAPIDGRWTLDKVQPGELRLYADDGKGSYARKQIQLAPGQALADVRLEFNPHE